MEPSELAVAPERPISPGADQSRPALPGEAWKPLVSLNTEPVSIPANGRVATASLIAAVEKMHAASGEARRRAFRVLLERMQAANDAVQFEDLARALRLSLTPTTDYTSAQSLSRFVRVLPEGLRGQSKTKIAILGGFATGQLRSLIELYLFASDVSAEIYESDYGVFRQEVLNADAALHEFQPDIVYFATHRRNLGHQPTVTSSPHEVNAMVEAEYGEWASLWHMAHDRLGCQILQNNFDSPPWRALSNYEMRHSGSLSRFIAEANRLLALRAPSYVTIHDVDALAANAGRRAWGDERFFLHAKMPCAPEYLVDYAHSVSSIIGAQLGLARKCLVLDLDNTLWGGVVGDDGLGGIRIGQGDAEAEGFLAFQHYVKGLRMRGVILAVCSKNDAQVAREVFEKHPEMLLRLDDISCFVANWEDKATNLRSIARQLNIGLDSLVFVDDNPAERSIIRQLVPEVAVPEISGDPVESIEALERHRYFQVTSLGSEDFQRTDYYRLNAQRAAVAANVGDVEDFLRSLDMVATIEPVREAALERSVQLINKSNQFNLTTRRRTISEVQALSQSRDWITATVRLSDRFGDNGLISVALGRVQGDVLEIDTWVMSCRVLKRGVERFLMNYLCDVARSCGAKFIRGEYIPTLKNELVRNHYAELGFREIEPKSVGHTVWQLSLGERKLLDNFIKRAGTNGRNP